MRSMKTLPPTVCCPAGCGEGSYSVAQICQLSSSCRRRYATTRLPSTSGFEDDFGAALMPDPVIVTLSLVENRMVSSSSKRSPPYDAGGQVVGMLNEPS